MAPKAKQEKVETEEEFVGRVLHYTGPTQHTRVITKDDFKQAGFTGMSDLTFGPENRHQIQEEQGKQFSDELLTYLVDEVGEFEIKEPKAGMKVDDTPLRKDVAGYQEVGSEPAADTVGGSGQALASGPASGGNGGSTASSSAGNGSST